MTGDTITHLKVPMLAKDRNACLGPDGTVALVVRTMKMIQGRWKLPILFRLYADPTIRSSQLLRELPTVSQKMLTQHLRELEKDGLIKRIDFDEQPLRVEYQLSETGWNLLPVLVTMRNFSANRSA